MTRFAFVTGHVFGQRALEGLLSCESAVCGSLECSLVVGLASELQHRTVGFATLRPMAEGHRIRYIETDDGTLRSLQGEIEASAPSYLIVVGWSRLVAPSVLAIPRGAIAGSSRGPLNAAAFGCIGMHPTPLPRGRGQAPLPWTIIHGCRTSALTTFFLEERADTGPIIRQEAFTLHERETSSTLFHRVADLHFHAGAALGPQLARSEVPSTAQDATRATVWPRRRPADSELVDFRDAALVQRTVRALRWPYPSAFVVVGGLAVDVLETRLLGPSPPGSNDGEILGWREEAAVVAAGGVRLELALAPRTQRDAPYVPSVGEILGSGAKRP